MIFGFYKKKGKLDKSLDIFKVYKKVKVRWHGEPQAVAKDLWMLDELAR